MRARTFLRACLFCLAAALVALPAPSSPAAPGSPPRNAGASPGGDSSGNAGGGQFQSRSSLPPRETLSVAAALLAKGDMDGAFPLYLRLIRLLPADDEVLHGLARTAAATKNWNQAVLAYEMLIEKHPGDPALHAGIAGAYTALGDTEAAQRSFAVQRALSGAAGSPDGAAAGTRAAAQEGGDFQVHGKVRGGALYDSNVTLGPPSDSLDLGNWRNVRVDGAKAVRSFGAYAGADLEMLRRLAAGSNLWMTAEARGFLRWYGNGELHDTRTRENQWARAGVGLRRVSARTLLDVRLKAEIFDYEFLQNVTAAGPEINAIFAVSPSLHLITAGGWDWRNYSASADRNGVYPWIGEYLRLFFGQSNHEIIVGARYLAGRAHKREHSFDGWEGSARFVYKLPHNLEISPHVSLAREDYRGPATILETENRSDTRWRLGLSATWRFAENWALEGSYQYTNNNSDSPLYDYTQHLVSTGVSWNF
jgi:hypothetical protein